MKMLVAPTMDTSNILPLQPEPAPVFHIDLSYTLGLDSSEGYYLNHNLARVSLENALVHIRAMIATKGSVAENSLGSVQELIDSALVDLEHNRPQIEHTEEQPGRDISESTDTNKDSDAKLAPQQSNILHMSGSIDQVGVVSRKLEIKEREEGIYCRLVQYFQDMQGYMAVEVEKILGAARKHLNSDKDSGDNLRQTVTTSIANFHRFHHAEHLEKPHWLPTLFPSDVSLKSAIWNFEGISHLQSAAYSHEVHSPIQGILYGAEKRWLFPLLLTMEAQCRWVLWILDTCSKTSMICDETITSFGLGWQGDSFEAEINGRYAWHIERSKNGFASVNVLGQDLLQVWGARVVMDYGGANGSPSALLEFPSRRL